MQVMMIVLPGMLGGLILALFIIRLGSRQKEEVVQTRLEPPSPHLINMAHIRVAGVGGLGMVAMAIIVAIFVPQIRLSMAIALVLGMALGAFLIVVRRREGPLPSSNSPGAHSMFPMDAPPPAVSKDGGPGHGGRGSELAAIGARSV